MSDTRFTDTATDTELIELFSLDSLDHLHSIATGKREILFIATEDGEWVKYESDSVWRFHRDPPE